MKYNKRCKLNKSICDMNEAKSLVTAVFRCSCSTKPRVLWMRRANGRCSDLTAYLMNAGAVWLRTAIDNLVEQQDMTVIIVAHRLSTVKKADKICVIEAWPRLDSQACCPVRMQAVWWRRAVTKSF